MHACHLGDVIFFPRSSITVTASTTSAGCSDLVSSCEADARTKCFNSRLSPHSRTQQNTAQLATRLPWSKYMAANCCASCKGVGMRCQMNVPVLPKVCCKLACLLAAIPCTVGAWSACSTTCSNTGSTGFQTRQVSPYGCAEDRRHCIAPSCQCTYNVYCLSLLSRYQAYIFCRFVWLSCARGFSVPFFIMWNCRRCRSYPAVLSSLNRGKSTEYELHSSEHHPRVQQVHQHNCTLCPKAMLVANTCEQPNSIRSFLPDILLCGQRHLWLRCHMWLCRCPCNYSSVHGLCG